MVSFSFGLLVPLVALTHAIPAIDTGVGEVKAGPPTDFAVLVNDNLPKLPESFTICSSTRTEAHVGRLIPFQLLQDDGSPWFTFIILAPQETTQKHRLILLVCNLLSFVCYC